MGESELCQVGLFSKSRAPLQDAQDLSTVLRSVLVQDTFSWLVKQCSHARAVFEIELSIQPSGPGHCVWDIPWSLQTYLDNWYLRSLERNVHSARCPAWGTQRVMFYSFMRIDVLVFPFSGISLDDSEE